MPGWREGAQTPRHGPRLLAALVWPHGHMCKHGCPPPREENGLQLTSVHPAGHTQAPGLPPLPQILFPFGLRHPPCSFPPGAVDPGEILLHALSRAVVFLPQEQLILGCVLLGVAKPAPSKPFPLKKINQLPQTGLLLLPPPSPAPHGAAQGKQPPHSSPASCWSPRKTNRSPVKNKPGFEILSVSIPRCLRAESPDDVNPLCQELAAGFHPEISPFSQSALGMLEVFPPLHSPGDSPLQTWFFQAPQPPLTSTTSTSCLPVGGRGVLWPVPHGRQLPAPAGPAPRSPGASSMATRQLLLTCWTSDVFLSPGINNPPNAHPPTQAASSRSPCSAAPSGAARLCVPWSPTLAKAQER